MRHLFIGGGGLVGSAAIQVARDIKLNWEATYREQLDLSQQPFTNLPTAIYTVYLIAAIRKLSHCSKNPLPTWRINVDAPIALAKHYSRQGTFVVFVSSDDVESSGADAYARQKAQAEAYMNTIDAAILRPGEISPATAAEFAGHMIAIGLSRQAGLYRWPTNQP